MMLHPDDNAAEVMYRFDKELAAHTKNTLSINIRGVTTKSKTESIKRLQKIN